MTARHPPKPEVLPRSALWMLARDTGAAVMLAVCSLGIGMGINRQSTDPLPLVYQSKASRLEAAVARAKPKSSLSTPGVQSQLREISLEEFQDFVSSRKGCVVDARPSVFYRSAHVPGALSVSRENFDADYARETGRLTARKDRPIAVYCSEADCQDSTLVASALMDLGYPVILVYRAGWAEWTQAGLPQESAP